MDRADFCRRPRRLEDGHDAVYFFPGQRPAILAEIDRQIGDAVGLVGREPGTGHRRQDLLGETVEPCARFGPLGLQQEVPPRHRSRGVVIAEIERAVLADDRVDRPEPGDHIAPAGRAPGHRDDAPAAFGEPLQCPIRRRAQPTVGGQRVVDIGQHEPHAPARLDREFGKRPHHVADHTRGGCPKWADFCGGFSPGPGAFPRQEKLHDEDSMSNCGQIRVLAYGAAVALPAIAFAAGPMQPGARDPHPIDTPQAAAVATTAVATPVPGPAAPASGQTTTTATATGRRHRAASAHLGQHLGLQPVRSWRSAAGVGRDGGEARLCLVHARRRPGGGRSAPWRQPGRDTGALDQR